MRCRPTRKWTTSPYVRADSVRNPSTSRRKAAKLPARKRWRGPGGSAVVVMVVSADVCVALVRCMGVSLWAESAVARRERRSDRYGSLYEDAYAGRLVCELCMLN